MCCALGHAGPDRKKISTQAREKGAELLKNLKEALEDHPNVGDVRGLGMMCGIEIVKDKATGEEFDASEKIGPKVHQAGVERGLFSRVRGDVYCLAPPIITTNHNSIKSSKSSKTPSRKF